TPLHIRWAALQSDGIVSSSHVIPVLHAVGEIGTSESNAPSVGQPEVLVGEKLGHGSAGYSPNGDQHNVIEVFWYGLQIVVDYEQRLSPIAQFTTQRDDGTFSCGIDALKRLVHQVDIVILHEGAGEKHPLLLAPRKLPDLPIGEILHPYFLQGVHGERAL